MTTNTIKIVFLVTFLLVVFGCRVSEAYCEKDSDCLPIACRVAACHEGTCVCADSGPPLARKNRGLIGRKLSE
ncbi:hypothetical protein ABFS83_11G081700 [Erythranthe nasuta]